MNDADDGNGVVSPLPSSVLDPLSEPVSEPEPAVELESEPKDPRGLDRSSMNMPCPSCCWIVASIAEDPGFCELKAYM